VSTPDDGLYRGDPPAGGYGPPPGYGPAPGTGPAPEYGPPPYGSVGPGPGYGPPPGWGWQRRPTNSLAVIALVLAFLGPLSVVGLGLGIAARSQIRRTGEEGENLAQAAIIIGGVISTLLATVLVFWIIVFSSLDADAFTP